MAKRGQSGALGRSRGGLTTQTYMVCDAQGRPMRFIYRRAGIGRSSAVPLLMGIEAGTVLADKEYESNRILAFIRSGGATSVIPPKANRK